MVTFLVVVAAVSVAVVAVQVSCLFAYEESKDVACGCDRVEAAQQFIAA